MQNNHHIATPQVIQKKLGQVRVRFVCVSMLSALAAAIIVFVGLLAAAVVIDWTFAPTSKIARASLSIIPWAAALTVFARAAIRVKRRAWHDEDVAKLVDGHIPELEERWYTVTNAGAQGTAEAQPTFMQMVANEAVAMGSLVIPRDLVGTIWLRRIATIAVIVLTIVVAGFVWNWSLSSVLLTRFWFPTGNQTLTSVSTLTGSGTFVRGESMQLQGVIDGRPVDSATLTIVDSNDQEHDIQIRPNETSELEYEVAMLSDSFRYQIVAGDGSTDWHTITTVERPIVEESELTISPPETSGKKPRVWHKLPRHVRADVGSELHVRVRASGPVEQAHLHLGEGNVVTMTPAEEAGWYVYRQTLTDDIQVAPVLKGDGSVESRRVRASRIQVVPDRPPTVEIVSTSNEREALPNDVLSLEFVARDDRGILSAELILFDDQIVDDDGQPLTLHSVDIPLHGQQYARNVKVQYDFPLEELGLRDGARIGYRVQVQEASDEQASRALRQRSNRNDTRKSQSERASVQAEVASVDELTKEMDNASTASGLAQSRDAAPDSEILTASDTASPPSTDKSVATTQPDPTDGTTPEPTDVANIPPSSPEPSEPSPEPSESVTPETGDRPSSSTEPRPVDNSPSASPTPERTAQISPTGRHRNTEAAQSEDRLPTTRLPSSPFGDPNLTTNRMATSKSVHITIDANANSVESRAQRELRNDIESLLGAMQSSVRNAQAQIAQAQSEVSPEESWSPEARAAVQQAIEQTEEAQRSGEILADRARSTPYEFVGTQASEIGQRQGTQAKEILTMVVETEAADELRKANQRLAEAAKLLEDLQREYEMARRRRQWNERLTEFDKLYVVYMEGIMDLAGSTGGGGPERKGIEYELDEAYLKRLAEVRALRQQLLAELARLLAEDPYLLSKYLDMLNRRNEQIRDQLLGLADQEDQLGTELQALRLIDDERREALTNWVGQRRTRNVDFIIAEASQIVRRFELYSPTNLDDAPVTVQDAAAHLQKVEETIKQMGWHDDAQTAPSDESGPEDRKELFTMVQTIQNEIQSTATLLRDAVENDDADTGLNQFMLMRMRESTVLVASANQWLEKMERLEGEELHRVFEMDQYEIRRGTEDLSSKIQDLETQIEGMFDTDDVTMPDRARELAREFRKTVDDQLIMQQYSAQFQLQRGDLNSAADRIEKVNETFEKAIALFDEMIKVIVEELDKAPDPPLPDLQDPTFDDLLAFLERELDAADLLGIPNRPTNIQMPSLLPGNGRGSVAMLPLEVRQNRRMLRRLMSRMRNAVGSPSNAADGSGMRADYQIWQPDPEKWNQLASRLQDELRQSSDNVPPERYRPAIDAYFQVISQVVDEMQREKASSDSESK